MSALIFSAVASGLLAKTPRTSLRSPGAADHTIATIAAAAA